MTIYKYALANLIKLPQDAILLSIGQDCDSQMCLWALVDPEAPLLPSRFELIGTGNPFPDTLCDWNCLGRIVMPPFIWHVFTDHPAELIRV